MTAKRLNIECNAKEYNTNECTWWYSKQWMKWILLIGKSGSIESISGDIISEQRRWRYCSIIWCYLIQWRTWSVGRRVASMAEYRCREHHTSRWNRRHQRWTLHTFTAIPHCPNSNIPCSLSAHKNKVCPVTLKSHCISAVLLFNDLFGNIKLSAESFQEHTPAIFVIIY